MKAREKLKIGYRDFRLSFIKQVDGGENLGCCDVHAGRIRVQKKQSSVDLANTTLHEILHAIWHHQGLTFSAKTEERVVNALSNGLTAFIRDNPKFILRLLRSAWKK
jgi:hypothetical protein